MANGRHVLGTVVAGWLTLGSLAASSGVAEEFPWLAAVESDGVVFFAFQSPPVVERFDLAALGWLDSIVLADEPTAFYADEDGLYIGFELQVSRFGRDGSEETVLAILDTAPEALFSLNDVLYAYDGRTMYSVDKEAGTVLDSMAFSDRLVGMSAAPATGYVYGWDYGSIPQDIARLELLADGTIGERVVDSPYHGDHRVGDRCFVFPGETIVADNSGTVYSAPGLIWVASLGGRFTDIAFVDDSLLIARDEMLIRYSDDFLRHSECSPGHRPLKIAVSGNSVVSFYDDGQKVVAEAIPVALLTPRVPGPSIDAEGLEFTPDQVAMGPDRTILLKSPLNRSVFRWSIDDIDFLPSISLLGSPEFMAYSDAAGSLFLAYPEGEITRIEIEGGVVSDEEPFTTTPRPILGFASAGEFLLTCDGGLPNLTPVGTLSLDGEFVWDVRSDEYAREYIWVEAQRRVYLLEDNMVPRDVSWFEIAEDGVIDNHDNSLQHSSDGMEDPLRVDRSGERIVLGSGWVLEGYGKEHVFTLPHTVDEAVWMDGFLYTALGDGDVTVLEKWNSEYEREGVVNFRGEPIRLLPSGNEMVLVTERAGKPRFVVVDGDLHGSGFSVSISDGKLSTLAYGRLVYSIEVANLGQDPVTGLHVQDVLPEDLFDASWTCVATRGSSCDPGPIGGDIFDTIDLAVGGVATYTLKATLSSSSDGTIVNRCEVFETGGAVYWDTDTTAVVTGTRRVGPESRRRP